MALLTGSICNLYIIQDHTIMQWHCQCNWRLISRLQT